MRRTRVGLGTPVAGFDVVFPVLNNRTKIGERERTPPVVKSKTNLVNANNGNEVIYVGNKIVNRRSRRSAVGRDHELRNCRHCYQSTSCRRSFSLIVSYIPLAREQHGRVRMGKTAGRVVRDSASIVVL